MQIMKENGMNVLQSKISLDRILKGIESGSITEVFGVGTASTAVPIDRLVYKNKEYVLPPYTENSIVYKIFNMLNQAYRGEIHPEWTHVIK